MTIQDLQKYGQLYSRWKNSFPFDLPYFRAFKDRLVHMPNKLIGKPANSNNFLIWTKPDVNDEAHFIERLTQLTRELLDHVQIHKLRQKAIIDNVEETRLTLSGEKLRIKNDALIQGLSSNEIKYVELLEDWIDNQINYFKENEDIFRKLSEQDAAWSNWTQEGEREFYKNKFYKDLKESPLDEIDFIDRELKRINLTLEQCSLGHTQETENLSAVKERNYKVHKEWLRERKKKLAKTNEFKSQDESSKLNSFEDLFYHNSDAELSLDILRMLKPPVIDAKNNYIGKNKGIFPLWINVLKSHKPEPIVKHYRDIHYKEVLNSKIKGLNLSNDASEFRKTYMRLKTQNVELDIKTILSQFSQSGKLGK